MFQALCPNFTCVILWIPHCDTQTQVLLLLLASCSRLTADHMLSSALNILPFDIFRHCMRQVLLFLHFVDSETETQEVKQKFIGDSVVAQMVKIHLPVQESWVQFLGGKIPWRKDWQHSPVFLLGKFHGQRSLVGYSPWGCKVLDTPELLTLSIFKFIQLQSTFVNRQQD